MIEAGPADAGEPEVEIPGLIGESVGGMYDWNLSTVPQMYLDGEPRSIPQGRALGGGTILNGMLWNRGGQGDFQNWVDLGNPGWSWDDLLPYFIKSETYTPPFSDALAEQFSIQAYEPAHGYSGPVNVSFPRFFWNSSAVLFDALNELGIPTAYDPNTGLITGASFLPLDLDPVTQERSTARKAYYDPYIGRPNLFVITGQIVTQVLFEGRTPHANASRPTPFDTSVGDGGSPGAVTMPDGIFGGPSISNDSDDMSVDLLPKKRSLLRRALLSLKRVITNTNVPHMKARQESLLRAIGVEYASSAQSTRGTVYASREVIVAAGALHSPQVLMMSGMYIIADNKHTG